MRAAPELYVRDPTAAGRRHDVSGRSFLYPRKKGEEAPEKGLEEQGTGLVPSTKNALRAADILLQIA